MWVRGSRGNNATFWLLPQFQSLPLLPTSKLGPSGTDSRAVGLVYVLTLWVSPTYFPVRLRVSPTATTPTRFCSQRFWGFSLLGWHPGLLSLCLLPSCSSPCICTWMWDLPVCQLLPHLLLHQLSPCLTSSPSHLLASAPPTSLDECFFFNSLVVRLPRHSIFWQFLLVFSFVLFLDLLLFFLWLCDEANIICLCLHPGWKSPCLFLSPVYREGNWSSENLNNLSKWKFHTSRESHGWNGNKRALTVHRVSLPRSLELISVHSKHRLGSNEKFQELNYLWQGDICTSKENSFMTSTMRIVLLSRVLIVPIREFLLRPSFCWTLSLPLGF